MYVCVRGRICENGHMREVRIFEGVSQALQFELVENRGGEVRVVRDSVNYCKDQWWSKRNRNVVQ